MSEAAKSDPVMQARLVYPSIGADPELFIATVDGSVVGSERVIPKEGSGTTWGSQVVRDGVQIELHPSPSTCRESFGASIRNVMQTLATNLAKTNFKASFEQVVRVPQKELDQLSDEAKMLGCAPSLNSHRPMATVRVAKRDQRVRSAGGHIHLGVDATTLGDLAKDSKGQPIYPEKVKKFVNLLDILVGLPCVLLDRDPNQRIRRRIYGRAGEHRLPKHGIEYRTPSNFWLRHYYLMHLVTGLARLAFECYYRSFIHGRVESNPWLGNQTPWTKINFDYYESLMKVVNMKKIERAINRNDYDLAMEQWLPVHDWIEAHVDPISCGLGVGTKDNFLYFVGKIKEKGLEYWFPEEPLDAWRTKNSGTGFETWLLSVGTQRLSEMASKKGAMS